MKVPSLILTIFMVAAAAAGQVTTAKDDISAEKYFAAEKKAAELLKTVNYRTYWTSEYPSDRSNDMKLQDATVSDFVQPNKWRTLSIKHHKKPRSEETIFDGQTYYFRTNGGRWKKSNVGSSSAPSIFGETVSNQYRHLRTTYYDGRTADLYELVSVRNALSSSRNGLLGIRYVYTARTWHSIDGYILEKREETAIETRQPFLRDITTYEYDHKDLKIEAPVK